MRYDMSYPARNGCCAKLRRHGRVLPTSVVLIGLLLTLLGDVYEECLFSTPGGHSVWAAQTPAAERSKRQRPLRYGWKVGQTLAYSVTVEADRGEYIAVLRGTPTYTVQSADDDSIELRFYGTLMESSRRKEQSPDSAGRFPFRPAFRPPLRSPFSAPTGVGPGALGRDSRLTMNTRGQVVRMTGSSQLPYLLGNLSQLMLETLPEKDQKKWTVNTEVAITQSQGWIPRPSFLRGRDETSTTATQETVYTIQETTDKEVVIGKSYELKTAALVNGKPQLEVTGTGQVRFNLAAGVPTSMDFELRLIAREENVTRETPVKVTYKLMDEAERQKLQQAAKVAAAEAAKPLSGSEREQTLADLASGEQVRFLRRLVELQQKTPDAPDDEMSSALAVYLEHEQDSIRYAAAKALETWATLKTVPVLVKALDDNFPIVRMSAMKALGRLKPARAAAPIAKRLPNPQDRIWAKEALREMGAMAEPAVLKLASHQAWEVRNEVCKILAEIGTRKSKPALKKMQNDENALVRQMASKALADIEKRP